MNNHISIKTCPDCTNNMCLHRVESRGQSLKRCYFYFLHCGSCGYGPLTAYDSLDEAISCWNQAAV